MSRKMRIRAPQDWLLPIVVSAVISMIASGCGNEEENRPTGALNLGGGTGFGGAVLSIGTCDESDEARECKVYHHQANGVTSCFSGVQFCEDGQWSDCLASDSEPSAE